MMNRRKFLGEFAGATIAAGSLGAVSPARGQQAPPSGRKLRKVEDLVIYQDARLYSAFPSIITRPDGELIVAFRRAPERRALGEGGSSHTDPNSYLVLVRSRDNGKSWTSEPELIYAHPFGGSQDPCLVQLRDGTLLCTSYGWALVEASAMGNNPGTIRAGNFIFTGGYILISADGGHHWSGPFIPPPVPGTETKALFGAPCPAYNRGAMCEGRDGRLYWAVAAHNPPTRGETAVHLMISSDKGATWEYSCPVADDEKVVFNEASLYETPKGDLVAFIRTEKFEDQTVVARSTDRGKSFRWKDAGFRGHPHHALRLPDDRVLLVYGYRHPPFGVRARVLNPECDNPWEADEIVLRDDGGNGDLGYPWATVTRDGRALVVYYFNTENGPRHIAGSFLSLD